MSTEFIFYIYKKCIVFVTCIHIESLVYTMVRNSCPSFTGRSTYTYLVTFWVLLSFCHCYTAYSVRDSDEKLVTVPSRSFYTSQEEPKNCFLDIMIILLIQYRDIDTGSPLIWKSIFPNIWNLIFPAQSWNKEVWQE